MTLGEESIKNCLRGVSVGLLTPFDEDGNIEHDKLAQNGSSLSQKDVQSFLAVANISEYHSLSHREKVQFAETCVDAVSSQAAVIAGVGGSTPDAKELIEAYTEIGVEAMMIMPPSHTFIHEDGLLDYYHELSNFSERPIIPYIRGFQPSIEFLKKLTRADNIIAMKYAIKDCMKLGAAVSEGDNEVVWINGLAEPHAISTWIEGCEGFSAGVSNFLPGIGQGLYEALSNENYEKARLIRNSCIPFQMFRSQGGGNGSIRSAMSVPAVKKGLELAGLYGGEVREPIRPLSDSEAEKVESLYESLEEDMAEILH